VVRKDGGNTDDRDEVNGYWVFALGVVVGILGVVVFTVTAPRTASRALDYALVAASPPLLMIGAVIRFPLQRLATTIAELSGLLTALGIVYFLVVFPEGWTLRGGNTAVNLLYGVGIVVIGLAAAFVPLVTTPVDRTAAEGAESAGTAAELKEAQTRIREPEDELTARKAELDAVRTSNARFELYADRGGDYRWRLHHRNGNIIADSGEGYASESGAEDAVERVQGYVSEAEALDVGQAAFEIYEDEVGEWRWRLRHRNGNVLADAGRGTRAAPTPKTPSTA